MPTSFYIITGLVAAIFAAIHLAGSRLTFLWTVPRSVWLSAAGGVSVAYVFVHLLPELAARQADFSDAAPTSALVELERHVYLLALLGLTVFYGLDRLARRSARRAKARSTADATVPIAVFQVHLGAFAVYNALIGYLLLQREDLGGLATYAVAMGLHFVVNDQGLRDHHGAAYRDTGRWLLAAAPLLGWAIGLAWTLPPLAVGALFALLAGGVVLNVLKEELPEDRDSRFVAFASGAAVYAALLLFVR